MSQKMSLANLRKIFMDVKTHLQFINCHCLAKVYHDICTFYCKFFALKYRNSRFLSAPTKQDQL